MLLRVLGPASGVCLVLAQSSLKYIAHGAPAFGWGGVTQCGSSLHLSICCPFCVCVCVCVRSIIDGILSQLGFSAHADI